MRVVQLCEGFSRSSETFIYDTVTELDRQDVDCHVLTLNRANQEKRPYEKVHLAPWPGRWNLPRLWRRTLATLGISGEVNTHKWPGLRRRFRHHLQRLEPGVVHAQFGPMGVLVAPVAEALDIPLVVTFHGHDISVLPQNKKTKKRYRVLFQQAKMLIGVSNHNCDKLLALGAPPEKVQVLHNGTRIEQFVYSNPSNRYKGGTVRLLHVGRLVEKKSPLDLVKAFKSAKEKLGSESPIHLTIAGEGPLTEPTEKKIRDLHLEEHINCLGAVPHAKVQQLMQTCHLYTQHCKTASNGDQEGQGVTFVEAQASGLPVVTTKHNGIPDVVVDSKTGYLVPEGDTEAMADQIAHLVRHPEMWEKMGRAGRQHVKKNFDLMKQVKKLVNLYRDLC